MKSDKDTKKLDFVYPHGTGSRWKHNELRYSLRSLPEHRKVWIVGYIPNWCTAEHISISDIYPDKQKNVIRKLLHICDDDRITPDFVFMNDDFFFLEKCDIISYTQGTLLKRKSTTGGKYRKAVGNTIKHIGNLKNFEVHFPIIINRRKFKEALKDINWEKDSVCYRSIYGNKYIKDTVEIQEDFKIYTGLEWRFKKNEPFISTDNSLAKYEKFQKWIQEKLPDPSKYEA